VAVGQAVHHPHSRVGHCRVLTPEARARGGDRSLPGIHGHCQYRVLVAHGDVIGGGNNGGHNVPEVALVHAHDPACHTTTAAMTITSPSIQACDSPTHPVATGWQASPEPPPPFLPLSRSQMQHNLFPPPPPPQR
jgi:hypothetical protein